MLIKMMQIISLTRKQMQRCTISRNSSTLIILKDDTWTKVLLQFTTVHVFVVTTKLQLFLTLTLDTKLPKFHLKLVLFQILRN